MTGHSPDMSEGGNGREGGQTRTRAYKRVRSPYPTGANSVKGWAAPLETQLHQQRHNRSDALSVSYQL